MSFLKKLFGGKKKEEEAVPGNQFSEEEYEKDYELKQQGLEQVLGKMHDMVGHAIIPFAIGGATDMYYFPNGIAGTGFATMELLDPAGNGPKPNRLGTYELVAFTKEAYNSGEDEQTAFNLVQSRICSIFTTIGNYSFEAVLNPNETCEVPVPPEEGKNICLVFDHYNPGNAEFKIGERQHHLLLCLEVFKSEMEFARQQGSAELFKLLKEKGFYPYSDMDRVAVA
ncbi:suppressor of fused domain protein [Ferruginibacter sp. SUN106]|uniref:suppressor of fused domain protein n=1 Tax=Ferruginibacter sp. SUN106 TaxID=2978348 RepID=UPI003D368F5D